MFVIRRREFIAGLGGAAAWPLAARAQQRAMPVIAYLSSRTAESDASMLVAVRRGLADVGYAEGRNVAIEYRTPPIESMAPEHPFRGYDMATPETSGQGHFSWLISLAPDEPRSPRALTRRAGLVLGFPLFCRPLEPARPRGHHALVGRTRRYAY